MPQYKSINSFFIVQLSHPYMTTGKTIALTRQTFVGKVMSLLFNMLSQSQKVKSLSRVQLFATPRTVAYQAPPSMGCSRQKYWSGLPLPSPQDLPNPGIEPRSPALQADALPSEPPGKPILQSKALKGNPLQPPRRLGKRNLPCY